MKKNMKTVNGIKFDRNDNNYYIALLEKSSHGIEQVRVMAEELESSTL